MTNNAPTPHHHGDLRNALIDAGVDILNEQGIAGLTLRRVAARTGVSHAAPAHHFDGLRGLLTAIATRAYALFTQHLRAGYERPAQGPHDRLLHICEGYCAFARAHTGLFHILFVSPNVDWSDPDLDRWSEAAYGVLREACLPFAANGQPDEALEHAVWSMVHGYSILMLGNHDKLKPQVSKLPDFAALFAHLSLPADPG